MKNLTAAAGAALAVMLSTPAFAADTPAPAPAQAAPQDFADADIAKFATAVIAIEHYRADTSLEEGEKQAKMKEALDQIGLPIPTFNAIAQQSNNDSALHEKIQQQITAQETTMKKQAEAAAASNKGA